MLNRHARVVVALPQTPIVSDEVLRDHEKGDTPCARRAVRSSGQDQLNDVLRKLVLAEGDEDLGPKDSVGAVVSGYSPGGQGTHIGTGLWFSQVHGARPLAGHHARQVGLLHTLVSEGMQSVQGSDGQHRPHRPSP